MCAFSAGSVAALAYHAAGGVMAAVNAGAGEDLHIEHCRLLTVSLVFTSMVLTQGMVMALGVCIAVSCLPAEALWFGKKGEPVRKRPACGDTAGMDIANTARYGRCRLQRPTETSSCTVRFLPTLADLHASAK